MEVLRHVRAGRRSTGDQKGKKRREYEEEMSEKKEQNRNKRKAQEKHNMIETKERHRGKKTR